MVATTPNGSDRSDEGMEYEADYSEAGRIENLPVLEENTTPLPVRAPGAGTGIQHYLDDAMEDVWPPEYNSVVATTYSLPTVSWAVNQLVGTDGSCLQLVREALDHLVEVRVLFTVAEARGRDCAGESREDREDGDRDLQASGSGTSGE